jgi:hypothetical protein
MIIEMLNAQGFWELVGHIFIITSAYGLAVLPFAVIRFACEKISKARE